VNASYTHEEVAEEGLRTRDNVAWHRPLNYSEDVAAYLRRYYPEEDFERSIHLAFRGDDAEYVALASGPLLRIHDVTMN
jgi:hypothetical protein